MSFGVFTAGEGVLFPLADGMPFVSSEKAPPQKK